MKKNSKVLTDAEPPDDPGAGDGGPDHGDAAGELGLEHTARVPPGPCQAGSEPEFRIQMSKLLVRGGPTDL